MKNTGESDLLSTHSYTQEAAEIYTLANGMTVCMEPLPYLHSASAGIWIKTGSANETPEESGIAHFLEHLFFKGTKTRSVHQIMEAIESRGGQLNAFTSREHTCLYVKVLDKYTATGIEIIADLIKNSLFADLEKERNVILEEITSAEDTPDDLVHDLMAAHHWPNHALGRAIAGTVESVSALNFDDVVAFYKKWYKPENMAMFWAAVPPHVSSCGFEKTKGWPTVFTPTTLFILRRAQWASMRRWRRNNWARP